jgi:hypothetical protein
MPPSPFELLNFLFATVVRKPPAVPFRQGAAVARYLDDLAYELEAGRERQYILLLSRVIWGKVFQFSKFKTATKEEATQFLDKFGQAHLVTYNVDAAVETVVSDLKRQSKPTKSRSEVAQVGMDFKDDTFRLCRNRDLVPSRKRAHHFDASTDRLLANDLDIDWLGRHVAAARLRGFAF